VSVGERAQAKSQQLQEQLLNEGEEMRRAASNMTMKAARESLRSSGAAPELLSLLDEHLFTHKSQGTQLRHTSHGHDQGQAKSGGIKKARKMLNDMINENNRKSDQLKTECSGFFDKQCSLMETCRSEIADANSESATWRSKVLFSQKEINVCEFRLPQIKQDLAVSIQQCTTRLGHLNRDLKIVLNDIEVMKTVLKMTECGPAFLQAEEAHIVECKHRCMNKSFMAFRHEGLNSQLAKLKSAAVRQLVQRSLRRLADSPVAASALPVDENGTVLVNVTVFKNQPLSQQPLPKDPCKGISYDAGGKPGCTLRSNPQCFNLQNKFLNIQGETVDTRERLLSEISELEKNCEETQKTLSDSSSYFEGRHDDNNALLAEATGGENQAAKEASQKAEEHADLEKAMLASRKDCTAKLRTFESEMCALKKIRGELSKLKGDKHPFFQDCEVGKWKADECSVSCGGGLQVLTRAIVSPQSGGGAECPPQTMRRACNQHPCPIDCKVSMWSRFSACSADCGGGVRERMRKVKVHPRYDGKPCGDLTETEACNMQACDRDCKLGHWSKYSACTRACGGGEKFSKRVVKVAAVGKGKCPKPKSKRRLKKLKCNTQECPRSGSKVFKCKSKMDLVLLLDGSGSIGASGWRETKKFASSLVDAFEGEDVQLALILFSGPRNWDDYQKCNGPDATKIKDQLKTCGVKIIHHFTNDTKMTRKEIAAMQWPKSSTYTSKALEMANAELILGRKDAYRVVLVMTDGVPISPDSTEIAAKKLRKRARLMFGAVRMNSEGLGYIQKWASSPLKDNVIRIKDFRTMSKIGSENGLLRDMCSKVAGRRPPMVQT
jgi:hypothetical protein